MLLEATWKVPPFSLESSLDVDGSTTSGEHGECMLDGAHSGESQGSTTPGEHSETLDFMLDGAPHREDGGSFMLDDAIPFEPLEFMLNGSITPAEHDKLLDFMLDVTRPYEDEEDDVEKEYVLDNIYMVEPDQEANDCHVAFLKVLSDRSMSQSLDPLPGPALLSALVQISGISPQRLGALEKDLVLSTSKSCPGAAFCHAPQAPRPMPLEATWKVSPFSLNSNLDSNGSTTAPRPMLLAMWKVLPFSLNSSLDVNGSTMQDEHDETLEFMLDAALSYEDEEVDDEEAHALDNLHMVKPDQNVNARLLKVLCNRSMSQGLDSLPGPALLSALFQTSRCTGHGGALVSE